MTGKVIPMSTSLAMLTAAELPGVSVTDLCREMGISRQSFYRKRRRLREEGPAGLEPRSRRPHRSPGMMPAELEDEIVRLRKELPLDNGAEVIRFHLERAGWSPLPSTRAIHRALVRRGLVTPQPQKRPKSSYRRFEYPEPNACWQIDATQWPLAGGLAAWIMDVLDDHSRVSLAARVGDVPTGALAWQALQAAGDWGLPAMVLSDNGTCFTARGDGLCDFERNLAAVGVRTVTSSAYHPQTCRKIERFHQTLKKWLRTQPLARSHRELQAQLNCFRAFYNEQRPHRALRGATPAERWAATPPARPATEPLPEPPTLSIGTVTVRDTGTITIGRRHITSVGMEHIGRQLTVIRYGLRVAILDGHQLLQRLTIDPTRRYQPSGRPRSRRPGTKLSPMS